MAGSTSRQSALAAASRMAICGPARGSTSGLAKMLPLNRLRRSRRVVEMPPEFMAVQRSCAMPGNSSGAAAALARMSWKLFGREQAHVFGQTC